MCIFLGVYNDEEKNQGKWDLMFHTSNIVAADGMMPSNTTGMDYLKFLCQIAYQLTQIFKHGFWLAGSTAANQSEAMFENAC